MNEKRCANCVYTDKKEVAETVHLLCMWDPPKVAFNGQGMMQTRPVVDADNWCGRFEVKSIILVGGSVS